MYSDLGSSACSEWPSCRALQNNSHLEHLSLSWNRLGEKGAHYIATAIACHPSLISVDLEKCALGPAGTEAIGYAIRENTTLKALNMSANRLDTKTSLVLVESLRRNCQLQVLMLRRQGLSLRTSLFAHAVPVYQYIIDASSSLALRSFPGSALLEPFCP